MDDAGAKALCSEDSLIALVSMADDEMQAFFRVCAQFSEEEHKIIQQHGDVEPHRQDLEKAVVEGIGINGGHAPFSRKDWHDLVAFRAKKTSPKAGENLGLEKSEIPETILCSTANDSIVPNKPCVFPFKFDDVVYEGCPTDLNVRYYNNR